MGTRVELGPTPRLIGARDLVVPPGCLDPADYGADAVIRAALSRSCTDEQIETINARTDTLLTQARERHTENLEIATRLRKLPPRRRQSFRQLPVNAATMTLLRRRTEPHPVCVCRPSVRTRSVRRVRRTARARARSPGRLADPEPEPPAPLAARRSGRLGTSE